MPDSVKYFGRGGVLVPEAYALGKMLDHSSWQKDDKKLPRGATSSDIDFPYVRFTIANRPAFIFCELSRTQKSFADLNGGQRMLYEDLLRCRELSCSVLCKHDVGPEHQRLIDTRHDIVECEVMVHDAGVFRFGHLRSNARWQDFVFKWFEPGGPVRLRHTILGQSVGMIMPPSNIVPMR